MRSSPRSPRSRSCGPTSSTPETCSELLHRCLEVGHDEPDLEVRLHDALLRRSTPVRRAYSAASVAVARAHPPRGDGRWRTEARTGGTVVDHVGLTVTDLDAAIAWYGAVFGLSVEQGPDGDRRNRGARSRHLRAGRRPTSGSPTSARRPASGCSSSSSPSRPWSAARRASSTGAPGISHIGLACADVAEAVARLEAHGGRRRSGIHGAPPGPVYCYCEDPDGNVIELIAPGD